MQASASVAVPVPPPPVSSAARSSASAVDALTARLNDKYQRSAVIDFGKSQFVGVSGRLSAFTAAYVRVRQKWNEEGDAEAGDAEAGGSRGDALRAEIAALGPVAVKVGQTLSQRPDILPKDVCEALKTLQTGNTPFADVDAWRVIADETGWDGPIAPGLAPPGCARPDGAPLFAKLSASPIAAASLGQVHLGTLKKNGQKVAVKVQRAGLRELFATDLKNLRKLCELLDSVDPKSDGADRSYIDVFDESEKLLYEEIDYLNEAKNADRFREQFANDPQVRVPEMIYEYVYCVPIDTPSTRRWRTSPTPSARRHVAVSERYTHRRHAVDATTESSLCTQRTGTRRPRS